jgi:hypothetical protein
MATESQPYVALLTEPASKRPKRKVKAARAKRAAGKVGNPKNVPRASSRGVLAARRPSSPTSRSASAHSVCCSPAICSTGSADARPSPPSAAGRSSQPASPRSRQPSATHPASRRRRPHEPRRSETSAQLSHARAVLPDLCGPRPGSDFGQAAMLKWVIESSSLHCGMPSVRSSTASDSFAGLPCGRCARRTFTCLVAAHLYFRRAAGYRDCGGRELFPVRRTGLCLRERSRR